MLRAAGWKYRTQKSCQKSPSRHHRTTLFGNIFATKACIDNRKKNLLSSNTSSTCPDNMVNFGQLTAEIGSGVWGTPTNFNGFRVLVTLLHSQTAALNRWRHLYSALQPSRWALAHISSSIFFFYLSFFPRLISAAADWMSTILPHMVCPSANLECRSERCCTRLAANADPKNVAIWAPSHNFVGLYLRN